MSGHYILAQPTMETTIRIGHCSWPAIYVGSHIYVAARFMQSGYGWSMLDLMLQFGSEDLVRELVSIGVPVLQPENILPKSSLSLTTKVAAAILDASA